MSKAFVCGGLAAFGLALIFSAGAAADHFCYTYDNQGRLADAIRDDGSRLAYTLDDNDNRELLERQTGQTAGCSTPSGTGSTTASNIAPLASADAISISASGSTAISVLNNDSDANGDTLSVTAVTQPSEGSASYGSTSVTYNAGATPGSYSVTYTISDGQGGSDTATVYVTVTIGS